MSNLLNLNNVDTTKEPIFLGKSLGLQRYDRIKYPVFLDLFKKQKEFFWGPEEISLVLDRAQYQELTDTEKFIFTKNLLFQTMLDSVICRGAPLFTQYVTNPELEACLNTWGFFEQIHSWSYTYIINNVYANPSKMFDSALEDPEIIARAKSACDSYDSLKLGKNPKEDIYLSLINVNILEAVRFYVSFICSFAFGENKKMVGNADIIKLIRRDEACVSEDTEVLTPTGWKKFSDLQPNEKVAQYNSDFSLEFVIPEKIIEKDYSGKMVNFKNPVGHVDMLLTPDHRVVYVNKQGEFKEQLAENFKPIAYKKIPVAGHLKNNGKKITDHERFLIALQADGSIPNPELRNGRISGCHTVIFNLKKDRKLVRLEELLKRLGYEFSISEADYKDRLTFYIKVPLENKVSKFFKDWIPDFDSVSLEWCQDFIEELINWDGHVRADTGTWYYSSTIEENVTIAQTIACLSGYKTYKYKQVDNRKETFNDVHRLSIVEHKSCIDAQSLNKTDIEYNGKVYCVSVPSGMFLVKRNDGIFVTGNCHLTTTQTIINILHKNKEEGFTDIAKSLQDKAIEMFVEAAKEEKKWAAYLFSRGSILGLNEQILCKYIDWLVNSRMKAIGLPIQFDTSKNPISGWSDAWMDSSKVQVAPQESEITSYKIGASNADVATSDYSEISL